MATKFSKETDGRLGELFLYIARKCEQQKHLGTVKLNKLMFLADTLAYARHGRSLTGAEYTKEAQGPCPVRSSEVRKNLVKSKAALVQPTKEGDRLTALRDANLGLYSNEQIAVVNQVLSDFSANTGTELSSFSHKFEGWKLANTGEKIPFATVFIPTKAVRLTRGQQEWARQMVLTMGGTPN